jgi:hypothetical protein
MVVKRFPRSVEEDEKKRRLQQAFSQPFQKQKFQPPTKPTNVVKPRTPALTTPKIDMSGLQKRLGTTPKSPGLMGGLQKRLPVSPNGVTLKRKEDEYDKDAILRRLRAKIKRF